MKAARAFGGLIVLMAAMTAGSAASAQPGTQPDTPPTTQPKSAPSAEQMFEQATDAIGLADYVKAATLLEAAAARADLADNKGLASEALFLVGELYEDQLDRPSDAAEAYRKIRAAYPDSRVAVAAGGRLEELDKMLGDAGDDGAKRLGRFLAIRREETDGSAFDALAAAEALLAEEPEWISAARVRLWMAGVALRDGQRSRARELYLEATHSADPDVVFEARMAAARMAREDGHFDSARELASSIDPAGVPGREQARREALLAIDRAESRAGIAVYALAYLIILPIVLISLIAFRRRSIVKTARALWPPPTETIYLVPVLAAFMVAAFTGHVGIAHAVVIVSVAGVGLSWVAGATLREFPRSWRISLAIGSSAALGVAAAFYMSLVRGGLVDLIISTVRFGPDV